MTATPYSDFVYDVIGGNPLVPYAEEDQEPGVYPSPRKPMAVARQLLRDVFTNPEGNPLLVHWRGEFWEYKGTHWQQATELSTRGHIYRELEDAVYLKSGDDGDPPVEVEWNPAQASVNNVLDPLRIICDELLSDDADAPAWLAGGDGAGDYVSLRNGLLHLTDREVIAHTPRMFNTFSLPFSYAPTATCPHWDAFLQDVFSHDRKGALLLQEYAGYIVSGRMDQHKGLLIVGPARAGKGTISRILKQLVGDDNTVSPSLHSIGSEFGLAGLIGKPFAVIEDARGDDDRRQNLTVERLLNIIGEDAVSVNRKNKDYWHGTLPTRFLLVSNEIPRFLDASGAVVTRFMSVKLRKSFLHQEDTTLGDKLLTELPGIFNWALRGLARLEMQGKFTQPDTQTEMQNLMTELASPLSAFLEDHYEVTGNATDFVLVKEMHNAYKDWCGEVGGHPVKQSVFMQRIEAADPLIECKNTTVEGQPKARRVFGVRDKPREGTSFYR